MLSDRYEGALNLRAIGGLPTVDGQRLRPGLLYRSGTPQLLRPAAARAIGADLGIGLVLDLRAAHEAESEGQGAFADVPHERVSLPFLVSAAQQAGSAVPKFAAVDPLVPHYVAYFRSSQNSVIGMFRALSRSDAPPALVHCTAGKDRTGAAVMFLLDALGVEREAIVADYVAGADEIEQVFDTLISLPSYGERLASLPVEAKGTDPDTAWRFLAAVDTELGGAGEWLRLHDFSDAELHGLRRRLLGPA